MFGQSTGFTIKGYSFGEDLAQVLTKSGEPDRLAFCRDYMATHKLKEFSSELEKVMSELKQSKKERDTATTISLCQPVLQAAQNAYAEVMLKGGGIAIFDAGKLVGFELLFLNVLRNASEQVPYEKIIADAINKYGEPTKQGTTTWENAFGATLHPRYAVWIRENTIVYVEEDAKTFNDISNRPANVTVTAALKSAIEHVRKEAVGGPNVLDAK